MNPAPHPSQFIDRHLVQKIRSLSAEAEAMRRLHPGQLAIIYAQKWFNLFVPDEYHGLALSLVDGLRTEEALAWTDGSTGWTVTLCSGANWFIGFLSPATRENFFTGHTVCLAGSGRPSGIAVMAENGYIINGSWNYATGAPFATAFTANCLIEKDGEIQSDDNGQPKMQAFIFEKDEVTIHDNWQVTGMIATASHRFDIKDLFVPEERCFTISDKTTVLSHPIYQYPFLQFAEATLAVNSSGMALHFLELCETIFKEKKINNGLLERSFNQLQHARELFYTTVLTTWNEITTSKNIPPELLQQVSSTSRMLAATARQLTDELYPYCGLTAANPHTEINRVWRDLHTASQHSLLTFPR